MRAFIKLNFLVKLIVIAISSVALVYETSELVQLYYKYPTVVNVKLEKEMIIEIPSMTICMSNFLTKSALKARYGKQIEEEMAENGCQMSNNMTINLNESKIYEKYSDLALKQIKIGNLFEMSVSDYEFISCNLSLPLLVQSERGFGCHSVSKVIESFNSNGKCFTYFSQLNQNPVDPQHYKVSLYQGLKAAQGGIANIEIKFPLEEYTNYWDIALASIAIHPPNMLPKDGKVHKLRPGINYDIYFSKTLSKLLPAPYETMCAIYQTNDPNKPQSRADCVDKCIISVWSELCNCTPAHVSVRRDVHHIRDYLCGSDQNVNNSFAGEMKNGCYDQCLPDCIDEEYDFDVEETSHPSDGNMKRAIASEKQSLELRRKRFSNIHLIRKSSGDVTYNHSPQMPFIEFICYVGSLASLWLGLSVLTIYDYLTKTLLLLYHNYYRLKNNNKTKTKISPKLNNVFVV